MAEPDAVIPVRRAGKSVIRLMKKRNGEVRLPSDHKMKK